MKLLKPKVAIVPAKKIAANKNLSLRAQDYVPGPKKPIAPALDVTDEMPEDIEDTEHGTGKLMRVVVTINDGKIKQGVRVRAGQPGLACNRAYKLARDTYDGRFKFVSATFDVEVME